MAGHRILIVDDEAVGLEILKDLLESTGYDVETAISGAEALEKFSPDFDLVILDVMLPVMDGYEVARRIRKHASHGSVPILMLTALKTDEDRQEAIEAGANDFATKPVDMENLEKKIGQLLKIDV